MKRLGFAVFLNLLLYSFLFAYSPGTTGFQFLKSNVGARPSAMGGAFVAVTGDVNALHYNPAGITTLDSRAGTATYADDILDISTGFMGMVQPNLWGGSVGLSVLYKNYGDFEKLDKTGESMGSFGVNNIAFNATYAIKVMDNLSVGFTGKYIHATIDNFSADAMALDGGIMYTIPSQDLTFAAGFFNVGQAVSAFVETKDDLPMNLRAGFSKRLAHLPLLLNVNVYKYSDESFQGIVGGEFTLSERLLFRLGYDLVGRKMHVDSSNDTFAGGAVGFGLIFSSFNIDYSYSSMGVLGSLNRFTLSGHF